MRIPSSLVNSLSRKAMKRRAVAMIVVVIVIILIIAGAASYYIFVFKAPGVPGSPGVTTTTTTTVGTTTASNAFKYYHGTFAYSNPLGPTGEMVFPNGTVSLYRTILSASGTFSFFINPANQSGSGSGKGAITATTTGFCTGQTSMNYTFALLDPNTVLYGNVTVGFDLPNPQNATYPLSCTNDKGVHYIGSGNFTYLSVFPNLISTASVPATLTLNQSGVYFLIRLDNGP